MYDYQCNACNTVVLDKRAALAERDRQFCPLCGAVLERQPHFRSIAVHIPVHMRAGYDETTLRSIAPPEPELRKEWHDAGVEQGIIKRPHHDWGLPGD